MQRLGTRSDLADVLRIRHAARRQYAGGDAPSPADEERTADAWRAHVDAGTAMVWTEQSTVAGFVILDDDAGATHVEQVTVDPAFARRGIGARLLDAAADHARARDADRLTLTTFRDVPWNAPYYERLGFAVVPAAQWSPALAARMERETAASTAPRVAMQRPV